MPWFRVDDGWLMHPKVQSIGKDGRALWIAGGVWSVSQLTDGAIPTYMLPVLAAQADVDPQVVHRLVDVCLWEQTDTGWQVHDWADYQPTRADVEAERSRKAQAGKAGASKRWQKNGRTDGSSHSTCHDSSHSTSDGTAAIGKAAEFRRNSDAPIPSHPNRDLISSNSLPQEPLGEDEEEWISKETAHRMAINPPRSPDGSPGWHKYRAAVAAQVRSEGRPTITGRVAPPSIGARVREPDEIEAASARAIRLAGYDDDAQERPSVAISDTFPAEMGHDSQDPYLTVMSGVQLFDEYDPNDPF